MRNRNMGRRSNAGVSKVPARAKDAVRIALTHEASGSFGDGGESSERALVERSFASLAAGLRVRDVAAAEGMSASALWKIVNKPEYARLRTEVYALARDSVEQRAMFHASRAIDRLAELVESKDERVALAAVNAVLDRAGFARVASVETTTVHATTTRATGADAADAARGTLTGLLSAVTVRRAVAERSWTEDVIDAMAEHDDAGARAVLHDASPFGASCTDASPFDDAGLVDDEHVDEGRS